ncbi:MAG TPA: lysylphosphatidylglycerol synthase transmembrane domain-containing protein [Anaerolineales bacterium]|nr:lysylphosphatidylglycerol synthase transmembrane domain-containing protein [Anaerolineales bacterium]
MRKIIVALILLLAIVFVFLRFSELKDFLTTLHHSNYRFLIAAFLVELIWMFNSATDYGSLYRLVGLKEKTLHLVLVATAANFVNVVAPSVGIGGMAVFLDDANRQNHSTGKVTVVGVLYILFDYLAFFCVLTLGFIVLIRRNNLNPGEITAAAILLLIAGAVAFLLFLGYKSTEQLGKALAWMARLINGVLRPFIHRDYIQPERPFTFAQEVGEGIVMLRGKRQELLWPFLYAANNFALLICVLAFTFLALGTPFTVGTLVGGFAISYLFLIVSPTPSGLGVVEGAMTIALNTLRVDMAAALLITLTYRFITFWFPLAIGAVTFRFLGGKSKPAPVS